MTTFADWNNDCVWFDGQATAYLYPPKGKPIFRWKKWPEELPENEGYYLVYRGKINDDKETRYAYFSYGNSVQKKSGVFIIPHDAAYREEDNEELYWIELPKFIEVNYPRLKHVGLPTA